MAQLLLLSSVAFGGEKPASCELASKSIVSRSSPGLVQVSNLGDIEITCRVPARPFPTKPGESRNGYRGYLEDRRPNSEGDPYQTVSRILKTINSVPKPSVAVISQNAA